MGQAGGAIIELSTMRKQYKSEARATAAAHEALLDLPKAV